MISFKEYFLLFENRQQMYGWMAPNGNIFPNQNDEVHADSASDLIVKFNISRTDHVYDSMFNAGWMRIEYVGNILYCNNNKMPPNDSQKRNLKRIAEQNRMSEIVFDSDRGERVIWSSQEN